ncbi:MAG: 2-dehydro-3-deoxyphosphogluconate aldolase [Planctomycetota bacterium]
MLSKQQVIERMCASGILPVFRTSDVRHLLAASQAYHNAGIGCVEYTLTMPHALDLLKEAAASLPAELLVGAGTVLDGRGVSLAVAAGADFIASPGLSAEMIKACRSHGVVSIAGAITPSEVMEALRLGADVIKVFPAVCVGPAFFAEILGPFPNLHLMAAGGMTLANVQDYVAAGAEVVTLLANGLDAAAYAAGDAPAITRAAAKWVQAVRAARSPLPRGERADVSFSERGVRGRGRARRGPLTRR